MINKFLKIKLFVLATLLWQQIVIAQNSIKGKIVDIISNESLVAADITCGKYATVSDFDGNYELNLPDGTYKVIVTYLGYKSFEQEISVANNQTVELNITLEEEAKNVLGNDIVITGSLFEKKASEEVISIEVVKPQLILNVNAIRIDEVARRISGLNVADGQANIRAGSGWAYGVGSRVMFIVDGQPILSPDRGDVKWTMLPVEAIGQLEVLKGASSVLYGSSAMNGTIHLQTVKPSKTPLTRFTAFQTFIAPPKDKVKQWWDFPVFSFGATFLRAHKPKDNFEYFVSGSVYLNNTQYEGGQEYMARMNYRTKWISKKNPKLSYGVAGTLMYNREYEFFFWQNGYDGAFRAGASNDFNNIRITVDPYLVVYDKKNNKHDLKTRSYFNRPSFDTKTFLENIDYSFAKNFSKIGLNMIVGTNNQLLFINVPAFGGNGVKMGNLWATYAQLDKKFGDRVTLSGGLRWEVYKYQKVSGVTPPVGRLGLNARVGKESYLRFNIGQAFRFPSFAERFVNQSVGENDKTITISDTIFDNGSFYIRNRDSIVDGSLLKILPNTNLQPEWGWTAEIGFQQKFNSSNQVYSGVFDFAFFWQEYRNLVDFGGVFDSTSNALVNLRAGNISKARIAGFDISLKNQFVKGKHQFTLNSGYVYSLPAELNPDLFSDPSTLTLKNYFKSFFRLFAKQATGADVIGLLKYRNRHLLTLDAEYTFDSKITIGLDARYYSKFENYDIVFAGIKDVTNYFYNIAGNDWVLNGRIFYTHEKKHTFGFIAKNITNNEYWLRAGKIETPLNFTFQYRYEF